MNSPRPVVHFKAPQCELQMTYDNAGVILYSYPYEELSMAKYQEGYSDEKWYIWDNALMQLMAKAGFAVIKREYEPEADVIDSYCNFQATLIDSEWQEMVK